MAQFNWPLVNSYPIQDNFPGPNAFPGSIAPAVWMNGDAVCFADTAATQAAPPTLGTVRRIDEPAPLTGSWTAPSDAERPIRDVGGLRLDPVGTGGGYKLARPDVAGIPSNACTIFFSIVERDGSAGPASAIFEDTFHSAGVFTIGDVLWVYYNGGTWTTAGLSAPIGKRTSGVIRYTPTGVDMRLIVDGVLSATVSFAVVLPATNVVGPWNIGLNSQNNACSYGSIPQAGAIPRAITDSERDLLLAYIHGRPAPVAYPTDRALIGWIGDSITRGDQVARSLSYAFLALANIRAANKASENMNVAIVGSGAPSALSVQLPILNAQVSAARAKNVVVIATGCNDLANGNGAATTISGIYAAADAARAAGWKVVLATLLPRSGAMSVSQATYNADRATVNANVIANFASHADALVNTTTLVGMGADGDSDSTTFYTADKVHPNAAGHALEEPVFRAAILSLL